ncbi:MAG: hypothetical protein JKY48_19370 [Flavobacteriales bacterium]|nr:hypothetical protein [Flavobacteriales bacterium]
MNLGLKDLSVYHTQLSFIEATAKQVQKDFQLYGEEISFNGSHSTAYEELYSQIMPIMARLLNLDSSRFFALLYAIDVDEKKVKELIFGNEEIDTASELTHLILKRELMKVVSRQMFAQKSNI